MDRGILHIYRNTPFGRETLLSSIYFSKKLNVELSIYIPKYKKINIYFEQEVVQLTLDDSYLLDPHLAPKRVINILKHENITAKFLQIKEFSASSLPDLPTNFSFMTCPRVIKGVLNKVYPGQIGPIVRKILLNANFPVYLPSLIFKPWKSITVAFGDSETSLKAAILGKKIAKRTNLPLYFFTQKENKDFSEYQSLLETYPPTKGLTSKISHWYFFTKGEFNQNIFEIPHDSLIIAGIFGHSILKGLTFGGKLESMQENLTNNFLLVGTNFDPKRNFWAPKIKK